MGAALSIEACRGVLGIDALEADPGANADAGASGGALPDGAIAVDAPDDMQPADASADAATDSGIARPDAADIEWAQWSDFAVSPDAGLFTLTTDTALDTRTGLEWQRSAATGAFTRDQATSYCAALALAGGGWRLPTRIELLSIVDFARWRPVFDTAVFPTPTDGFLPTQSPGVIATTGWRLSVSDGQMTQATLPQFATLVRCVR